MASDVVLLEENERLRRKEGSKTSGRSLGVTCVASPRPSAPARPPAWPRESAASHLFLQNRQKNPTIKDADRTSDHASERVLPRRTSSLQGRVSPENTSFQPDWCVKLQAKANLQWRTEQVWN